MAEGPAGGPGVVARPSRRSMSGWEALTEVCEWSGGLQEVQEWQEALPEVREWSRGPPGGP